MSLKPQAIPRDWKTLLRIFLALALLLRLSLFDLDESIFRVTVWACSLLAIALMVYVPGERLAEWVRLPQAAQVSSRASKMFAAAGFLVLAATYTYLERQQPFYFTQEDTHTIFFPAILHAARGFFNEGIFPTWNGYQSLGVPNATLGTYALTYPFTYLAYALARYVCGNEFMTIEVFSILHLMAGYVLCFMMLRRLHVRPSLACAGALCFVLQGYNLIAVRSWYHNSPTATYLAALGLSLAIFIHTSKLSRRWVAGTALAIGLYLHAGNLQLWFYGVMLWGLAMLWVLACKEKFWVHLPPLMMSAAAGLAIAMPLLLLQIIEEQDVPRGQVSASIAQSLGNLLLPWPIVSTPEAWGDQINSGTLYFSGAVFIFAFMVRCAFELAYLVRGKLRRDSLISPGLALVAILALVLAMGPAGELWTWLLRYSPFSHFRYPFRFLPFATFFMTINGVLWAETALRRCRSDRVRYAEASVALLASGLVVYNAMNCRATFAFCPDRPYPALLDSQKIFQASGWSTRGRVFPIAPYRKYVRGTPLTLILNYPSLFDIPVVFGHYPWEIDNTLPENLKANAIFKNDRTTFYREFGIEWVTVSTVNKKFFMEEVVRGDKAKKKFFPEDADADDLRKISSEVVDHEAMQAFHIGNAETKPMAYLASAPKTPLPYRIRNDGVDIDLQLAAQGGQTVVANFLYRHWFKAYTEAGLPLEVRPDDMGRLAVDLPGAASMVSIRYCPPWHYGLYLGLALVALAGGLGWAVRKCCRVA